jgi:hypothetical protein
MSEKIRNFENNLKEMRGFYVTKMKRDQATGHYIGVATWMPKNAPLPGSRTSHNNRWSVTREMSLQATSQLHNAENFAPSRGNNDQSEQRYRSATNDDFSRFANEEKRQADDATRKKSSFYDPYEL